MAVFYKLTQNKNAGMASTYQKWYARTVVADTKTLKDVAKLIEQNCSLKQSDVWGVLTEFVEVVTDMLQNSFRVKIDGLGSFKLGMSSKGADNIEDFSVSENVRKLRVLFQPETTIDSSTGKRVKAMLQGATLSDISKLASKEALDAESENESTGG